MLFNVFLKRFLPFCVAVICGLTVVFFAKEMFPRSIKMVRSDTDSSIHASSAKTRISSHPNFPFETTKNTGSGWGSSGAHYDSGHRLRTRTGTNKVNLFSKPKAEYTDAARENNVEGTVLLKVVLLASGGIGAITPVKELPYGLTEQAIAAARQIKFEPKTVNGIPVSTIVTIEYGFSIY